MISIYDINEMIDRIVKAGADVFGGDFAIYTNKDTKFREAVYPLEIIVSDGLPSGVTCIITRKPNDSGLKTLPPAIMKGKYPKGTVGADIEAAFRRGL